MYKNKLTPEVTIDNQFGPLDAKSLIKNVLNISAISSVDLIKLETDYRTPSTICENYKCMVNIPCKIK